MCLKYGQCLQCRSKLSIDIDTGRVSCSKCSFTLSGQLYSHMAEKTRRRDRIHKRKVYAN